MRAWGDGETDYTLSPRACESIEMRSVMQGYSWKGSPQERRSAAASSRESTRNTRADGFKVFLARFIRARILRFSAFPWIWRGSLERRSARRD